MIKQCKICGVCLMNLYPTATYFLDNNNNIILGNQILRYLQFQFYSTKVNPKGNSLIINFEYTAFTQLL